MALTRFQISEVLDEAGIGYHWDAEGCELRDGWTLRSGVLAGGNGDQWFFWHLPSNKQSEGCARTVKELRLLVASWQGKPIPRTIRWRKVNWGFYSTEDGAGDVINYQHYSGRPSRRWNAVVRGECNESFDSKREAVEYVERQLRGGRS